MWSSQSSVASVPVWSRQSSVASVPVWSSQSSVASVPVWSKQSSVASVPVWSSQSSVAPVPVWSRQSSVASVPVWSSRSGVEQSRVEQTSVEQSRVEQTSVEGSSVDSTQGESVPPVGSLGFRMYKEVIEPDRTAPEFRCPGEGSGLSLRESRLKSSRAEFESTTARERHRYWCPVHGKASAGGGLVGFIQYIEGDK